MTDLIKVKPATGIRAYEPPNFDNDKWLICANQACDRLILVKDDGKATAFDYKMEPFSLDVAPLLDLFSCLPDGIAFDGGIVNYVSAEDFQYHVVDCLKVSEFNGTETSPVLSERLERLKETADALLVFKDIVTGFKHLYFAPHLIADTGIFEAMKAGMSAAGWKGIILRKDVPYEPGESANNLKYYPEGETK